MNIREITKILSNSGIEENEAKIELINEKIELEKNSITNISIIRGIEILTEEY